VVVAPLDQHDLGIGVQQRVRCKTAAMVLRSEPSGFIEWMRSPLSSRRNRRPDRVTDGAFVPDRAAGATAIAVEVVDLI
jgi:hypothetical protein